MYSVEERTFVVEVYLVTKSFVTTQKKFLEKYPQSMQIPTERAIVKMVQKFRETGSLTNKKRNRTRRVLNEECLSQIRTH